MAPVSGFPTDQIRKTVESVIEEHGFQEYDIEIHCGSNHGDNYMGIVFKVTATEKTTNRKVHLFIKTAPTSQQRRQLMHTNLIFEREIFIYEKVIPTFIQMQDDSKITRDAFDNYAKCCKTLLLEHSETLVFEDLEISGYKMLDRLKLLNFDHCKLTVAALAKYHAFSFALRDQTPDVFKSLTKNIHEIMFADYRENKGVDYFVNAGIGRALAVLDKEDDSIRREKVKYVEEKWVKLFTKCLEGANAEPYSVIGHGDCCITNFMYSYEEDNITPKSVRLVDWQVARYVSPVLDLVHLIFVNTDQTLRDLHYDDLLQLYYDTLSDFLAALGSSPHKMFPYSAYRQQLDTFGIYGMLMAILLLPGLTANIEDVPDMDVMMKDMVEAPPGTTIFGNSKNTAYEERLRSMIDDCIKFKYV